MSYLCNYNQRGRNSISISQDNHTSISRYSSIDQGFSVGPIPYTRELALYIKSYLKRIFEKDWRFEIVPGDIIDIVGNELKRFMTAVESYCMNPRSKLSKEYLIDNFDNKEFATYLKKLRSKSFLISRDLVLLEEDTALLSIPSIRIDSIDEIFNYSYWFFWEEEEPEDYLKGFKHLVEPSPESCKKFKEKLKQLLPKTINRIEEEEILLSNSSSSGLTNDQKSKKVYILKQSENTFSRDPLIGKRSIIPVSPGNYRDAIILSVPQSNSVKLIEKQCSEICQDMANSAHYRRRDQLLSRIDQIYSNFSFYFDRDIEKEGITKPRFLCQWTLEVLEEFYPGLPAWKYRGIFNDFFLIKDNEKLNPDRGHGLGMANSLTTIIQCVLFHIILDDMKEEEFIVGKIDAIFFNDDCTIGFEYQDDFDNYNNYEDIVFKEYGMIRKETKSHWGESGLVFCENYKPDPFNCKEIYSQTALNTIFSACNISHAKMICSNLNDFVDDDTIKIELDKIISFWGYEFDFQERFLPNSFGGWITPILSGVRTDLYYLDDSPCNKIYRLFCASQNSSLIIEKKRKKASKMLYSDPITQVYGNLDLPERLINLLNLEVPRNMISEKFQGWSNRKQMEKAFWRLKIKRDTTFKKTEGRSLNLMEYQRLLSLDNPDKDILPTPKTFRSSISINKAFQKRENPIYENPNKLLSILEFYNRGEVSKKVLPDRRSFFSQMPNSRLMTSQERRKLEFSFANWKRQNLIGSAIYSLENFIPKRRYILEWNDPNSVACAYATLTGDYVLPLRYTSKERDDIQVEDKELLDVYYYKEPKAFLQLVGKFGYESCRFILKYEHTELMEILETIINNKTQEMLMEEANENRYVPLKKNKKVNVDLQPWLVYNISDLIYSSSIDLLEHNGVTSNLISARGKYDLYKSYIGDSSIVSIDKRKLALTELEEFFWIKMGGQISKQDNLTYPYIKIESEDEELSDFDPFEVNYSDF